MTATLACRGPDESGIWVDGPIGLGHTRLAVIDIDGGHQPMRRMTRDGRLLAVTFGGEIYNYVSLREVLANLGHVFETRSDTEVVLRAYEQWGETCFTKLRGMFAIGLWDSGKKKLLLARDPLGVKPLYFASTPSSLLFASEVKALLAHPAVDCRVGPEGLAELLSMWPYKTPGANIYRNVQEVRPGEVVDVSPDMTYSRTRYWQLRPEPHQESLHATVSRVRELLGEIVGQQLQSDIPVGFLLSGGVDSSGLVGLSAGLKALGEQPRTFSVEFKDGHRDFVPSAFRPNEDEPFIDLMVREAGLNHTRFQLTAEEIHAHEQEACRSRDFPDTGDMDVSLFLLFRYIKAHVSVCLTGEGADEVFGGYPWFLSARSAPPETFPWRKFLCFPQEFVSQATKEALSLDEYVQDRFADAVREVPVVEGESATTTALRQMTYLDITRFLPGQLERKDRASMANGVEARVPYCDQELVQYVWNVPGELKSNGGVEKWLLREALAGGLPQEIRQRRKASYPTLLAAGHEAYLRAAVLRVIADRDWPLAGVLDRQRIAAVLDNQTAAPSTRPSVWLGRIWSLYRWWLDYQPSFIDLPGE